MSSAWRLSPISILGPVAPRAIWVTLAISLAMLAGGTLLALPLWGIAVVTLLPWLPIYLTAFRWQRVHYGAYSFFGALTLLQLGHLAEHVAQNVQLLITHGNTAMAHGIFGGLDLETVHFIWNVLIWLGTGALLYRFGTQNLWLWLAFLAASVHSIEHIYLYWLYVGDHSFYLAGGSAGILARGGLIGSPLARPYLHLVYNLVEVTPFTMAFWDQGRLFEHRAGCHGQADRP